jgi:hypothetical protein
MHEQILNVFDAVVLRVLQEQQNKSPATNDQTNMRIGKCMNILRMIVEKQEYISAFPQQLEEKLMPLYLYMGNPSVISFDEDILIILKGFIKKSQRVTQV